MSDMETEAMACPHCGGPLDVTHNARDSVTIARPVIDDLRAAGWVVLTKAEYEELRESRESWRVLCCDTVAKNIEQQAQLAAMREALKVSLEHWEMYEEFFVIPEREAFGWSSAVLESSTQADLFEDYDERRSVG